MGQGWRTESEAAAARCDLGSIELIIDPTHCPCRPGAIRVIRIMTPIPKSLITSTRDPDRHSPSLKSLVKGGITILWNEFLVDDDVE
jgi:hypothetical protein